MRDIVVIGSLNMDLVVKTPHLPQAGETLQGEGLQRIPGGKGANQAVASARLGASVAMVGRVGHDGFGDDLRQSLTDTGVDVAHVWRDEVVTGTAVILVDEQGENCIVISAGANGEVSPADIDSVEPLLKTAKLLLLQFEIPMASVERAAQLAAENGVRVILNPAPAQPISPSLLKNCHMLVPNENELHTLTGLPVETMADMETAVRHLQSQGVNTVIVTLGSKGALMVTADIAEHIPAFDVDAVDTTSAGDAFIGGLAATLSQGAALSEAVQRATATAALTVTKFGAQPSLPTADEVDAFLKETAVSSLFENLHDK